MTKKADLSVEKFKSIMLSNAATEALQFLLKGKFEHPKIEQLFDLYMNFTAEQLSEVNQWIVDDSNMQSHLEIGNAFIKTCLLAKFFDVDHGSYMLSGVLGPNLTDDVLEGKERLISNIMDWFYEAVDAHLGRMELLGGNADNHYSIRIYTEKCSDVTTVEIDIELEFGHIPDHLFLWDTAAFELPKGISPTTLGSMISEASDFDHPATLYGKKSEENYKDFPLYKYHPVRFEKTRPYIKEIANHAKEMGYVPGEIHQDLLNILSEHISLKTNQENARKPLRHRLDGANIVGDRSVLNTEMEKFLMYNSFRAAGRRIFDLNDTLVEMFHHTDFNNIPVSFLNSPFSSFYIHFGHHDWLKAESGAFIDGAYVEHLPDEKLIQFCFTTAPGSIGDVYQWGNGDESLAIAIKNDDYDLTLDKALESVLNQRRADLHKKKALGDRDATQEIKEGFTKEGLPTEFMEGHTVIINDETMSTYRLDALEKTIGALRAGLALVANSLCYLTAYPDDIDLEWASETPRSMIERSEKGNAKIKENTLSKLTSMGYRKVYLCGRKLNVGAMEGAISSEGGSSSGKRRHWRRLHWRLQAHGKDMALRKAILIAPVLINPGAGFDDSEGVIYIDKNVINMSEAKKRLKIDSKRYWG